MPKRFQPEPVWVSSGCPLASEEQQLGAKKPVSDRLKLAIEAASQYAQGHDCDVFLFNSQFNAGLDADIIAQFDRRRRRQNLLLILVSEGGNPDAAYKISRALQKRYERFTAFVHGYCKSAGTLCVLGAHEAVISESGELGPLDVQVAKKDEIGESDSGLVTSEALRSLKNQAFEMLLEPLFAQINPFQVGEMARSMRIAQDYGRRLGAYGQNLTEDALELLCDTYPSHGFVIDNDEAALLFRNHRAPSPEESAIVNALGSVADIPAGKPVLIFLNRESTRNNDENAEVGAVGEGNKAASAEPSDAAGLGRAAPATARRKRVPKSAQAQAAQA